MELHPAASAHCNCRPGLSIAHGCPPWWKFDPLVSVPRAGEFGAKRAGLRSITATIPPMLSAALRFRSESPFPTTVVGQTLRPPYELWGVSDPGGGSPPAKFLPPPEIFLNPTENCCPPRPTSKKKHCPCILEGRLTRNPILSALHLQGLKFNIYVHFHLVNKSLIGISFRK